MSIYIDICANVLGWMISTQWIFIAWLQWHIC